MKKMILTGLGSEQKFETSHGDDGLNHHVKSGQAEYYLVFNDGELRIPISEEAAHVVVQHMYGTTSESKEEEGSDDGQSFTVPEEDEGEGGVDEDGVDQI